MGEGKEEAQGIVIALRRRDEFGWEGEIYVNGEDAGEVSAGNAEVVLDGLWSIAFYDDVGHDALFTTKQDSDASR